MIGRISLLLAAALLLGSCAAAPIPEGYTGPTARIADSWAARSGRSADFFYLAAIDGREIDNDLTTTAGANYGRGFSMTPMGYARDVPARPATFTIVGRTHYAAPILELLNKVYEVKGDISFAPAPGRSYVVKGVLGDQGSAVWIEDAATGALVAPKIEVKGSATLGFFEK